MKKDIIDLIKSRRSIRRYKQKTISDDLIKKCIEAACSAPSAKNSQPWSFVIIKNKEKIKLLSKTQPFSKFLENAPCVIVVLAEESKSNHWLEDCSCAIMLLLLEAHSLGLGACWNAVYKPDDNSRENYVRKILNISEKYRVIANIGIGHPDEKPTPKKTKSFEEAVIYSD
jgi:nitroreductase